MLGYESAKDTIIVEVHINQAKIKYKIKKRLICGDSYIQFSKNMKDKKKE